MRPLKSFWICIARSKWNNLPCENGENEQKKEKRVEINAVKICVFLRMIYYKNAKTKSALL